MKNCLWLAVVFVLSTFVMAQQTPVAVQEEPHHHVVLTNESVMVVEVKLLPGESTLFHTHSYDRVAIDLTSTTITRQKSGEPVSAPELTKPGDVAASESNGPYTHRVHNIGAVNFEALDVELLHRPTKCIWFDCREGGGGKFKRASLQVDVVAGNRICDAYSRTPLPDYFGNASGVEDDGSGWKVTHP